MREDHNHQNSMQRRILTGFLDWLWANGFRVVRIGTRPEERPDQGTLLEAYANHLRNQESVE